MWRTSFSIQKKKLTISYPLKLEGNQLNSAHLVLKDKKHYQLEKVCNSKFHDILDDFLKETHIQINLNDRLFNHNPWCIDNTNIDLSFLEQYSVIKLYDTNIRNQIINNTIHTQNDIYDHLIFLDGSVDSCGKVGAALFAPSLNLEIKLKLPDHLSIYYAEAYAILYALKTILNLNLPKFCLFSDCTTVLNHIKYTNLESSPHPYLIRDIFELLTKLHSCKYLLKWMPGHSNHPDFITVDKLAKLSTSSTNTIVIDYSKYEALLGIEPWICSSWMKKWEMNPTGKYQNSFKPNMNVIKENASRKKDMIINRLRLLQTKLNSGLYKLGIHQTGECDVCRVEETCEHFLLKCTKTEVLRRRIKTHHKAKQSTWRYEDIMGNEKVLDIIASYVIEQGITI